MEMSGTYKFEKLGGGFHMARSPRHQGVSVLLTGSRGRWAAQVVDGKGTRGEVVETTGTQAEACDAALAAM